MKSSYPAMLVRHSLSYLGEDIREARLRRRYPMQVLAERAGISRATLAKIQKGDPSVSMGSYAAVIFALGFRTPFGQLLNIANDHVGQALDAQRLPKRIRLPRNESDTSQAQETRGVCDGGTDDGLDEQGTAWEDDNTMK